MHKRMVFTIIIFILFILGFINVFLAIEYNTNLKEFFIDSGELSQEEREWLNAYGDIIYGSDNYAPPLRYTDEESKQYKGIVVDYINALSIELGKEIKAEPLVWTQALESLSTGKTQLCDMYPSEERAKYFLFSKPIYNEKSIILVPKDNNEIKYSRDLKNKTIAAQQGDYVVEFLNSTVDNINYTFVPDYYEGILLLEKGEVSAVVGDEPVISYMIDQRGLRDKFKILDNPIFEKECVFALPKSEKKLLSIINKGIYNLDRKETMSKIQQKWFGISTPFIKQKTNEKIGLSIGLFIIALFGGIFMFSSWNHQLKREVQKRTEELYVSRNDLETTFNGLTNLMIVLNEDCSIVNVNKAFSELAKMENKEIIGRNCNEFPFLFTDCDACVIRKTLLDEKNYQKEFKYSNKTYEMSTFPLKDKEENIHRVLIMVKDITNIRISEQQLLLSNKMAAVGQLAAGVAHEIRNPLGLIRSYCYMLKKNTRSDNNINQEAVEVIESSVEKASNVIENLLNFSRISSNEYEYINIGNLIDSILKLECKVMAKKNIKEKIICNEDILFYVNEESIKYILINLISNAIDAMPDGGVLTISCEKAQETLNISCADTGIGINKKDLENIFNPFFTTKPPGKGTGLGLYVVYNEVQKLAGNIRVTSQEGEGTTFYIKLPSRREKIYYEKEFQL